MIFRELRCRLNRAWARLVFLVRIHWHAVEVADALHDLEDEAALYLVCRDIRGVKVVRAAHRALLRCGRGVKGW